MILESETKKWGNSLGIIIPRTIVESEHLKEHENLRLILVRDNKKALRETFGKLKLKRPTEEILKEVDKESWDE